LKEFACAPLKLVSGYAVNSGRGTPPERIAMLRAAIEKTVKDPQFQAEAKKAKINMKFISAPDVIKGFDELMAQPPRVLEAMGKYLKVGSG
jgi:tripartite-type tricarboxylate transporter receptor subunit TctC